MDRDEACRAYNVNEDGIICSPGKFEGEPVFAPVFWDMALEGCATEDLGSVVLFELDDEDRAEWPELGDAKWLALEESEQGFVRHVLSDERPEIDEPYADGE